MCKKDFKSCISILPRHKSHMNAFVNANLDAYTWTINKFVCFLHHSAPVDDGISELKTACMSRLSITDNWTARLVVCKLLHLQLWSTVRAPHLGLVFSLYFWASVKDTNLYVQGQGQGQCADIHVDTAVITQSDSFDVKSHFHSDFFNSMEAKN